MSNLKKLSFILLIICFTACDDWPGDPITSSDDETSANLDNGGSGSESNPYEIGSGTFTILDDDDYYEFEVEDSDADGECTLVLYDIYSNSGEYTISSDDATYATNIYGEIYNTYNYMSAGTFVITNSSSENSQFGLFSTCVDSVSDYSIREFTSTNNSYEVDTSYELFTFELSSDSDISFTYSDSDFSYSTYLFDEDFERVYSFEDVEEGIYYILVGGSSSEIPTITFSID